MIRDVLSGGWFFATLVAFGGPSLQDAPDVQHIFNGEQVATCGWPSVVTLGNGSCTGTLIHPLIVLTAAHCVNDGFPTPIAFGESVGSSYTLGQTEYCRQGPGWNGATAQGQDYAYCKLQTPVTSVPIIPVAAGCEQSAIYTGARIMHVGFGVTETGSGGQKRMLDTRIDFVTGSGEILSGDDNKVICNGDSGGPTFVYLDPAVGGDGTWRVAAIHSWAQGASPSNPNCFGQAGSVLVSQAIDWIEQDSGIDITPCTTGDDWAPTYQCGRFANEPWLASGSYPMGCEHGDMVEFPAICGPALAADDFAPLAQILSPAHEDQFAPDEGLYALTIEADAMDEGWGIASVQLTIRNVASGSEQADTRDAWQAWAWPVNLPSGTYEAEVIATDYAGNVSEPSIVCFGVGELSCPEDEPESDDTTGDDGSTSEVDDDAIVAEESDDDGATTAPADGDRGGGGDGCGCRANPADPRGPLFFAFAGVLLAFRRRVR